MIVLQVWVVPCYCSWRHHPRGRSQGIGVCILSLGAAQHRILHVSLLTCQFSLSSIICSTHTCTDPRRTSTPKSARMYPHQQHNVPATGLQSLLACNSAFSPNLAVTAISAGMQMCFLIEHSPDELIFQLGNVQLFGCWS